MKTQYRNVTLNTFVLKFTFEISTITQVKLTITKRYDPLVKIEFIKSKAKLPPWKEKKVILFRLYHYIFYTTKKY